MSLLYHIFFIFWDTLDRPAKIPNKIWIFLKHLLYYLQIIKKYIWHQNQ